ncbi:MAG TPA: hypothetical protein VF459_18760 [Caulobacteraceae bacterium]
MASRSIILILSGVALTLATTVSAQTAIRTDASAALTAAAFGKPTGPPATDLSASRRLPTVSYAGAPILRHDGVAKTAIDHRFDADGVVGSVGYLCGMDHLAPDTNLSGGGPTSGFGRQGTFLGASLGYSFR